MSEKSWPTEGKKDPDILGWYSKESDPTTTYRGISKGKGINKSLKSISNTYHLVRIRLMGWIDSTEKSQDWTLQSRSHYLLPSVIVIQTRGKKVLKRK